LPLSFSTRHSSSAIVSSGFTVTCTSVPSNPSCTLTVIIWCPFLFQWQCWAVCCHLCYG
jgi:hypothetical protein